MVHWVNHWAPVFVCVGAVFLFCCLFFTAAGVVEAWHCLVYTLWDSHWAPKRVAGSAMPSIGSAIGRQWMVDRA
ncbi:hypothetical protein F5H01DRAFT_355495 [Linnemannia elongata]|nr:hypothetical protein F5H01DRAFT_355495 [Linnemannia elongata]